MTQLAKYHGRAPRYVLNTEDNNLIRYSGSERWSWEEKTEIRNVSLTGLSFIAPSDLSPLLGEIIKIQFVIPGSKQMACYAIVIRIDKDGDFENLIAVHFYKLDRLQRINLLIKHTTCLPASAALISALTKGELSPVRYKVILIARTSGSSDAS